MKKFLLWFFTLTITVLMLIYPEESVQYARESLTLCADTVIPALFPFFILSGLLIYSGFCSLPATLLKPVMKPLFNVNENGSGAFILGIISGYPLGAVTACRLYEAGYLSKYETERLLSFCNNSGPLFILGAMGICMFHSSKIGFLLYVAHLLAAVTVGIFFRFYKKNKHTAPDSQLSSPQKDLSGIYSQVMESSVSTILTICGSVVFFGAVAKLVTAHLPLTPVLRATLSALFEMSGGIGEISSLQISLANRLLLSGIAVGFAGISVHLQVVSVLSRYNLSLFPYFTGKVLHGLLSGVYLLVLLKFFPVADSVFASGGTSYSFGFFIAFALLACSVLFFIILSVFCPRKKCARKRAVI